MGKKQKAQAPVFVAPATPTAAPAQTADALAAQQSLQQQLAQMRQQYETQIASLGTQYQQNQQSSNSVLEQLQQSLAKQQQDSMSSAQQLKEAQAVSATQAGLLADAKAAAQATYADSRQQNVNMNNSLFGRLQRRQQTQQVKY